MNKYQIYPCISAQELCGVAQITVTFDMRQEDNGNVYLVPNIDAELSRLNAKISELEKDASRQCGWLVEAARDDNPQRYRTMDDAGIYWTTDPSQAIRFARREDAEMFAAGDEDAWHIVEHMFIDSKLNVPGNK